MDLHTIYNILYDFASKSDDIDLKRSMNIPPCKLQIKQAILDKLNHVMWVKRLNMFNRDNSTIVNVFQYTHQEAVFLFKYTAYDWFTGERVRTPYNDELVSIPDSFLQGILGILKKFAKSTK